MRQGQQSRRGRGRGRKVQNPLARNFESNGPDVKIRGTAAHIAEKYSTLARDASASGDSVMVENYLQHAEHYNRIIMAAQAQFTANAQPAVDGANGAGGQRHRRPQGMDEGGRMGGDVYASGDDDMDEAEEPDQPAEMAGSEQAGEGQGSGNNRRRRANGADGAGGNEADAELKAPPEDTPDSLTT